MLLNRAFDDRISALYRQGKISGGAFGSRGQEACSVGSAYALEEHDVVGPMIRNSGVILTRGLPIRKFFANYLGRATSPTGGRDGNTHLGDLSLGIVAPISHLSSLIPVLAGVALTFKLRGEKRVAITWIGDGGSSVGDFHEGLNLASVMKLPFVLVLENNQYAYSTPTSMQCAASKFSDKAAGYGIRGVTVDGNDVLAVHHAVKDAANRARSGDGPTLIEAVTMRMKGHAEHDDAGYVPTALLAEWAKRDPIERFRRLLRSRRLLTEEEDRATEDRVAREIEKAVMEALSDPFPDGPTALDGVYAERSEDRGPA
ncbi:MAG: thiamine pyrophosphate-dependent dehydrogenase E1 component subunit alpha [Candidatus Wallbacteria bacterium]|nr:thiamine pyrophosphate-dependent dehydrogenase E1 component subunit alpha [Candidatus Wallbacteria bacterium]